MGYTIEQRIEDQEVVCLVEDNLFMKDNTSLVVYGISHNILILSV